MYNQGLREQLRQRQSTALKTKRPNFFENISRNSGGLDRSKGSRGSSYSSKRSFKQTIGNAERKSFFEFEPSPGPSCYLINNSSFTKATKKTFIDLMPGKPKERINVNPGPGQYINEHFKLKGSPSAIIGSARLQSSFHVEQSPGPGDYSTERSSVLKSLQQAITIRNRPREKTSCSPGPLSYLSEIAKDRQCMPRSPVVCIASAGRKDTFRIDHKATNPGPANYILDMKKGGP